MTREQFMARLEELSAESAIAEAEHVASGEEVPYWWLSFIDPDRPQGDRFLAVSIVQAATGVGSVSRAWALGINPGGEVLWEGPLLAEAWDQAFRDEWCERLLDKDGVAKFHELMA
jgi:hypothetical protein